MIVWAILHLIDRGERLPISEVREHIDDGTIFEWLKARFPNDAIDLSLYDVGRPDDRSAVLELFQGLNDAVDARRKFGVEEDGLCLLIAYCTEGVQQASQ
jgi:hypothetical protein